VARYPAVEQLRSRLGNRVKKELPNGGFEAICPCHDDHKPSLIVTPSVKGNALICCRAGCDTLEILNSLSIPYAELFQEFWNGKALPSRERDKKGESYFYRNASGGVAYEIIRKPGKDFLQRSKQADGSWKFKGPEKKLPYQLDRLLELPRGSRVWVVEGEKDADRLWSLGLPATCNPGGAGKWKTLDAETVKMAFAGQDIVILPDDDSPGQKHAVDVSERLQGVSRSQTVLDLHWREGMPERGKGGDVSNWLDSGGTLEDLQSLAKGNQPKPLITLISPSDAAALKPPEWIVHSQIPESAVVVLYGPSGCGKSFLILDILAHVALRTPWWNIVVRGGPVAYIVAEGGPQAMGKRIRAWSQWGTRPPIDKLDGELFLIPEPVQIVDQATALIEILKPLELKIVVFDTVSRCAVGKEENSAKDMGEVIDRASKIRDQTGATVLLVHHVGKDESRGPRGSYTIMGNVDTVLRMDKITGGRESILMVEKQRDGEAGQRFLVKFEELKLFKISEIPEIDLDETGEPRTSLVISGFSSDVGVAENRQELLSMAAMLTPIGLSKSSKIIERYREKRKVGERTVERYLSALVKEGYLIRDGGQYKVTERAEKEYGPFE